MINLQVTEDELRQLYYGIEFAKKSLLATDRDSIKDTFGPDYFQKTLTKLIDLESKLVSAFYTKDK